jgi:hypothetical protein
MLNAKNHNTDAKITVTIMGQIGIICLFIIIVIGQK